MKKSTEIWQRISFWKKVICRQCVYYRRQINVSCTWFGSEYGGFYVVDGLLNPDSIVYSFGVGEDITFDLSLIEAFAANVYAFDPTPLAIKFLNSQELPEKFHFESIGISNKDESAKLYLSSDSRDVSGSIYSSGQKKDWIEVQMKKLSTIMKENSHSKIDLLKMDVEGSEYDVLENMLNEKIFPKQILVEFHHRFVKIGIGKTKRIISKLNSTGYKIAKISESKLEYTFLLCE